MFTALHDIQPLFQLVFLITCCVIVSCLTALFYLQRLYKKTAQEGFGRFTLVVDRPEIVLAKINAANLSDVCKI